MNSTSTDEVRGGRRRLAARRLATTLAVLGAHAALAALAALPPLTASALLSGCAESEWPDREPLIVDNVPVDSLEFLPRGSRYILEDSLTPVAFHRFRVGYACTDVEVLELEKQAAAGGASPGFAPHIRLRLPENADCPVDTALRDDTLPWRFAHGDGPTVRLVDSLGRVLDSAALVRGVLHADSLLLVAPAKSIAKDAFFYRDTVGRERNLLSADSLTSCELLNHAEFRRQGDSVRVRYTWVTVDPAPENDSCRAAAHGDTLFPLPYSR